VIRHTINVIGARIKSDEISQHFGIKTNKADILLLSKMYDVPWAKADTVGVLDEVVALTYEGE